MTATGNGGSLLSASNPRLGLLGLYDYIHKNAQLGGKNQGRRVKTRFCKSPYKPQKSISYNRLMNRDPIFVEILCV